MIHQPGVSAMLVVGGVALGLVVIFGAVFLGQWANSRDAPLTKPTGGYAGECILLDQYFKDTSIADDPKKTLDALVARYPNAKKVEDNIRAVLAKGKTEGINPAMPLAIWWGEQNFLSPEKAFGYGYRDSGKIPAADNWEFQLAGVYRAISDAINARGNYTKKEEARGQDNIFTRLFFTYATAMRQSYIRSGYRWLGTEGPVAARVGVLQTLVPQQLSCNQPTEIDSPGTPPSNPKNPPKTPGGPPGSEGMPAS